MEFILLTAISEDFSEIGKKFGNKNDAQASSKSMNLIEFCDRDCPKGGRKSPRCLFPVIWSENSTVKVLTNFPNQNPKSVIRGRHL
ncbi:MAG: hypothetical protein RMX68_018375 [Aulosira sp. ZfuVER01]|nr:hypothetical protein [Aulosira sp. DedVER01a]MDZ8051245.1 hypothetical protein [Aulosira sp. ZfuCHP01]